MAKAITENTLFYGDNLEILRDYLIDECIDLVYLDPPFNSNRNYNVLFKDEQGLDSEAQIVAFEDTWHWGPETEHAYYHLITHGPDKVVGMITALRGFIGTNQMMAYLIMMASRLIELHRVLKPTGSLYLHCDPTASHYLKLILDTIFGSQNYRNEIIWHYGQRTAFHNNHFSRKHDVILFYAKSSNAILNPVATPWMREEFLTHRHDVKVDENGKEFIWTDGGKPGVRYKRYVEDVLKEGKPLDSVWDIPLLNSSSKERLGYPTQKPLVLLERIVQAGSKPGDVVLDPFCGCGTAIAAAQKLNRKWIGIDITHLSIALQKYRLEAMFPSIKFEVIGEPEDIGAAKKLAQDDRYQFQWWALSLIRAKPLGGLEGNKTGKKGRDKGIDGIINFVDDSTGKSKRVIVQVKSGHVKSGDIRDLVGTVQREEAAIGVFITLEPSTRDMRTEAASTGLYHSTGWGKDYSRIQILSIAELLQGAEVKMPPQHGTFKSAQRVQKGAPEVQQVGLDFDEEEVEQR